MKLNPPGCHFVTVVSVVWWYFIYPYDWGYQCLFFQIYRFICYEPVGPRVLCLSKVSRHFSKPIPKCFVYSSNCILQSVTRYYFRSPCHEWPVSISSTMFIWSVTASKRLSYGHLLPIDTSIFFLFWKYPPLWYNTRSLGSGLLPDPFIFLMPIYGPHYAPVAHITSRWLSP